MKSKYIIVILLTLFQIPFLWNYLSSIYQEFERICINKDFLSWDVNIRFIITLNMMEDLRNWEIHKFIIRFFDAPTWPTLRNVIQTIVFYSTEPSGINDIRITFVTFLFLFPAGLYVLNKETIKEKIYFLPFVFLLFWTLVVQSEPIILYSLTGMLEIQGSIFLLLSLYFVSKTYTEQDILNSKLRYHIGIFSFLLFLSKYPYGVFLILGVFAFQGIFYFKETYSFAIKYLLYCKNSIRKNYRLWILFILIPTLLFVTKSNLGGKIILYIKYLILFLACLDFYLYFFREKKNFEYPLHNRMVLFFQWMVLPILVWVLLNPDRIGGITDAATFVKAEGFQKDFQVEKNLMYYFHFFESFFKTSFINKFFTYLVFSSILGSLFWGSFHFIKHKEVQKHLVFSFHIFITFFILLFLTPNHQGRHFYHLYPSFILTFLLFIISLADKLKYAIIIFISALSLYSAYPLVFNPSSQIKETELCFMGYLPEDYDLPRWVDNSLKEEIKPNTVFLNYLDPNHVNKSDAEVLLALSAFKKNARISINPKKIEKLPSSFKTLLTAANSCSILDNAPLVEILKNGNWKLKKEESYDKGCIRSFELGSKPTL